jgi:hypothetical protein
MTPQEAIEKYVTLTDDLALFYHGPLSQWWYSKFVVDDVVYNCTEQYMMHKKAQVFGDKETAYAIMHVKPLNPAFITQKDFTEFPREQKRLGRLVKPFNEDIWDNICRPLVFRGNTARYQQDSLFHAMLELTGQRTIVEASPYDPIWGIGMKRDDPLARDKATWKGKNYLGYVLTDVRDMVD